MSTQLTTISGRVSSLIDDSPVRLIRITAYREREEVGHAVTDEQGKYELELADQQTVTLRFDTNPSFVNVDDWHPSIMTNVFVAGPMTLDRPLSKCGFSASIVAVADILSAYLFCALWMTTDEATHAIRRLQQLLAITPLQTSLQRSLQEHFRSQTTNPVTT